MNTDRSDSDFPAVTEPGCTIAFRTAGVFGGGLTLVTILAGLFGH